MAATIPWEAIRRQYVEGRRDIRGSIVYPTYEGLARQYTIGLSTVTSRGAREKWPEQRRAFQEQIVEKATSVQTHRDALIELDQAAINAAARGIACIDALFDRFGDQLRDKTRTKQQLLSDVVDLEQLSRALLNFQSAGQGRAAEAAERR